MTQTGISKKESSDYRSQLICRFGILIQDLIKSADSLSHVDALSANRIFRVIKAMISFKNYVMKTNSTDITSNPFLIGMIEKAIYDGTSCLNVVKQADEQSYRLIAKALRGKVIELGWLLRSSREYLNTSNLKGLGNASRASAILLQHLAWFSVSSLDKYTLQVNLCIKAMSQYSHHDLRIGANGIPTSLDASDLIKWAKAKRTTKIDIANNVSVSLDESGNYLVEFQIPRERVVRERMMQKSMYISVKAIGTYLKAQEKLNKVKEPSSNLNNSIILSPGDYPDIGKTSFILRLFEIFSGLVKY